MEKIKKWLEPTKNQVILGVVASLLIGVAAYSVYSLTRPKKPTITFKENIVLEYGQITDYDIQLVNILEASGIELSDKAKDIKTISETVLPQVKTDDLIELKESKFDSLAFDSLSLGDSKDEKESATKESSVAQMENLPTLNSQQIGKHKGKVFAKLGNEIKVFEFDYEVKDTHMPQFDAVTNIDTPFGAEPQFSDIIKATDVVDGDLEVIITGAIDYTVSGIYQMKAGATDKNNNTTEHEFTVTVAEEIIIPDPQENNSSGSNNNDNTGNTGNTENTGNNNTGNTNHGTGTTGGTQTPPVTTPPVTPPVAPPVEENTPPPGMLLYKDYGTFEACAAAIDAVSDKYIAEWQNSMCDYDGKLFYRPN